MSLLRRLLRHVNPPVFVPSAVLIIGFVAFGALFTETAQRTFAAVQSAIVGVAGWYYVLCTAFFLVFAVALFFTPLGRVRLGGDDERPAYSAAAWFAMLFSAGIGISVLFYSVAEPVLHYTAPPRGAARTPAAAQQALGYAFLHWGLHGWAIYVIVGLSLAYFSFRKGLPLTIRSALYPIFGERIHGPIGHAADVFAVLGTMFGVATSLGLGAMQLNAGLGHLFGVPGDAAWIQLALIAGITAMATTSVVLGLTRGIRRLSLVNMALAVTLLVFAFAFGPTGHLLESLAGNLGYYLRTLPARSLETGLLDGDVGAEWMGTWTLFYWGWWIAWSPFVGMFIARISRGRTVRGFIAGVLGAGSGFIFVWMTVFGDAALFYETQGAGAIAQTVEETLPAAFFALLDQLPFAPVTSALALALMVLLFVTSSDSGSLVIDIITAGGDPDPPVPQRVFWAVLEGCVAAVLLVAGGLEALQTASIASALPFSLVLLAMCYGLARAMLAERRGEALVPHAPTGGRADATSAGADERDREAARARAEQ